MFAMSAVNARRYIFRVVRLASHSPRTSPFPEGECAFHGAPRHVCLCKSARRRDGSPRRARLNIVELSLSTIYRPCLVYINENLPRNTKASLHVVTCTTDSRRLRRRDKMKMDCLHERRARRSHPRVFSIFVLLEGFEGRRDSHSVQPIIRLQTHLHKSSVNITSLAFESVSWLAIPGCMLRSIISRAHLSAACRYTSPPRLLDYLTLSSGARQELILARDNASLFRSPPIATLKRRRGSFLPISTSFE